MVELGPLVSGDAGQGLANIGRGLGGSPVRSSHIVSCKHASGSPWGACGGTELDGRRFAQGGALPFRFFSLLSS